MNNLTKCIFVLIMLLFVIPQQIVYADSPALNQAVTITDMTLQQVGGDSLFLKVKYTPTLSDSGSLRLYFPKHIAPFNQAPGEMWRDIPMSFTANVSDSISFLLKEKSLGSSLLQVGMAVATPQLAITDLPLVLLKLSIAQGNLGS